MTNRPNLLPARVLALCCLGSLMAGATAQIVAGATVAVHASGVPGALRLAFAADGTLYCGRDPAYTGTSTAQFITRIGPGGSPVQAFGQIPTPDPDVVVVDTTGSISGIAGAVITGGITVANTSASISAIHPDGSVVELWTSTAWRNPADLKIDASGRLLFADQASRTIWQSIAGAAPTALFTMPGGATPAYMTLAADQRIFIGDTGGRIYEYSPTGTLLNANFATLPSMASIEFATGAGFGTDLYALAVHTGTLYSIAANGTATTIGTGLGNQLSDLRGGPDGRLYYSNWATSKVMVITPDAAHVAYGVGCHGPAPLTLSAGPAPVLNPSTLATYSITNVPEFAPGSGLYLSLLFLSFTPLPGGIELNGLLTTQPGCRAYVATLDLGIGAAVTTQPSNQVQFLFAPPFAPGSTIAAQAVALFDPNFPLPNGESGGIVVSNGVLSTTQTQ